MVKTIERPVEASSSSSSGTLSPTERAILISRGVQVARRPRLGKVAKKTLRPAPIIHVHLHPSSSTSSVSNRTAKAAPKKAAAVKVADFFSSPADCTGLMPESDYHEVFENPDRHPIIIYTDKKKNDQALRRATHSWNYFRISPFSSNPAVIEQWFALCGVQPGTFEAYMSVFKKSLGKLENDDSIAPCYSHVARRHIAKLLSGQPSSNKGMDNTSDAINFFNAVLGDDTQARMKFIRNGHSNLNPGGGSRLKGSLGVKEAQQMLALPSFTGPENQVFADALVMLCAFGFRQNKLHTLRVSDFIKGIRPSQQVHWFFVGRTDKRKSSTNDDDGKIQQSVVVWNDRVDEVLRRASQRNARQKEDYIFDHFDMGALRLRVKEAAALLNLDEDLVWSLHSSRSGSAHDAAVFKHKEIYGQHDERLPDLSDPRIIEYVMSVTGHEQPSSAFAYALAPDDRALKIKVRESLLKNEKIVYTSQAAAKRGKHAKGQAYLVGVPSEYQALYKANRDFENSLKKSKKAPVAKRAGKKKK